MSEEILINHTAHETRVALVEGGVLQEFYVERRNKLGLVGNIYQGRVSRVLPGMQSAFVDIGLERTGFLHVSDILESFENVEETRIVRPLHSVSIDTVLKEGQQILVQVIKDPLGSKGARLTTRISIPSRYLVLVPSQPVLGISQRIVAEAERERLRQTIFEYHGERPMSLANPDEIFVIHPADISQTDILKRGGFIVRTAAEGIAREEIYKDIEFLHKLWDSAWQISQSCPTPSIVYEDLPLAIRTIRDMVNADTDKVLIDSPEIYKRALSFTSQFLPEFSGRIELYDDERHIMDMYSIEDEVQKSLNRRVPLKSGGHIVIDQTEAMTTIDVNTGTFVGHRNHEETIYKTNLEATQAIARQLRLRNLGGIIIIDFIDMKDPEHRRQVLRALEKHLEHDHSRYEFSELTSLGLVQLTRKRTRESLEHVLCEPCPTCNGRGTVKTAETVCYEIYREIQREVRQFDTRKLLIVASQSVIDLLMNEQSTYIADLEEMIKKPVSLQIESMYTQEQYDIVLL